MNPSNGPDALVQALAETLGRERDALAALDDAFQRQLAALRTGDQPAHEQAAHDAGDTLARLDELRAARTRQTRLLGRVLRLEEEASLENLAESLTGRDALRSRLLDARAAVRDGAAQVRQRGEALGFALRHALTLGSELLRAMQAPEGPRVYDASGQAAQAAAPRPLVNRIG